jgi:hypothetical protein
MIKISLPLTWQMMPVENSPHLHDKNISTFNLANDASGK